MSQVEKQDSKKKRDKEKQGVPKTGTSKLSNLPTIMLGLAIIIAIPVGMTFWMGDRIFEIQQHIVERIDKTVRSAGFEVATIDVVGVERQSAKIGTILDSTGIGIGDNMFAADPYLIQNKVQSTGLVTSVDVHRLWPNRIVILVDREVVPVALFLEGRQWTVVGSNGKVLENEEPHSYSNLMKIEGSGAIKAIPKLVNTLQNFPEIKRRLVSATRVSNRRWDIQLETGVAVNLPSDKDLVSALQRLRDVDRHTGLSKRSIGRIDLRVKGHLFITPSGGINGRDA